MGAVLGSALYIGLWRLEVTTLITWDQCSMTPVGRLITGEVGYKPDPVVPVDQQGVCAALVTGASHVGEAVQIAICFFSRDILELSFPRRRTLAQREPVSSFFYWGTVTQSDGKEDLGDNCTVKMRSQAGLVVSLACERRQPVAPRATGKPRDLKDDLALFLPPLEGVCATETMGRTF
jgi:hypothetical protein